MRGSTRTLVFRPRRIRPSQTMVLVAICLSSAFGCSKRVAPPAAAEAPRAVDGRPLEAPSAVSARSENLRAESPVAQGSDSRAAAPAARRMIVRTAQVRVVVTDPAAVAKSLSALVESSGGFISESKQWQDGDQVRATLTFRVPVKQLYPTLDAIRKSALRIESENVTGQDVTAEFTDLTAEMANLEATERELRELLTAVRERTQSAAEILEVFNQLTRIRGDIERIRARVVTLSQLTELSTINLELVPDALSKPITGGEWRPITVVRSAVRTLVSTLGSLFDALIWILIYALPVILVLSIPVLLVRSAVRAYRRRSASRD